MSAPGEQGLARCKLQRSVSEGNGEEAGRFQKINVLQMYLLSAFCGFLL